MSVVPYMFVSRDVHASIVLIILFAVLLENSGLMKAGPRQSEFEPQQGKTYKFSDVHGVDEAKSVRSLRSLDFSRSLTCFTGTPRGRRVLERSHHIYDAWWQAA